jgi:hypothetical protein
MIGRERFIELEDENQWRPCPNIEASNLTVLPIISSASYTNLTTKSTQMTTTTSVLVKTTSTKRIQLHRPPPCEKTLSAVFEGLRKISFYLFMNISKIFRSKLNNLCCIA